MNIITATHETGWACGPIPVKKKVELRRRSGKATREAIYFLIKCGYSNIVTTTADPSLGRKRKTRISEEIPLSTRMLF